MSRKGARLPRLMPDDCSLLALAAYDVLMGGVMLPKDLGRHETNSWLAEHAADLAALLRSDEPIPSAIRAAWADAIDCADAPVRITLKQGRKRPFRLAHLADAQERGRVGEKEYEAARARGENHARRLEEAAAKAGTNTKEMAKLLADRRLDRRAAERIQDAIKAGKSVQEIAKIMSTPLKRKRGPSKLPNLGTTLSPNKV